MGYWTSRGGGGYEEYECELIRTMDNGSDGGHDDTSSRGFSVWEKQRQMILCIDWKGISACHGK